MNKTMKKYIIFLIAFCLTAVSCNEMLDLEADGRTSLDKIFSERNGITGYLNSCYGYCPAPYMDRASLTDEAQDADDLTAGSKFAVWYSDGVTASNYASYSADGGPWAGLYQGIRNCNVFLERIGSVDRSVTGISANEVAGWSAQAHTLRALYYLQLAKRYGAVPVLAGTYATDHDYSGDRREPFSAVVKQIVADCDAALETSVEAFGWGVPTNSFGVMTRAVPYAIKSQAATYAASPLWADGTYDWDDALDISREALGTLLANDYKLFDVVPQEDIAQNPYALYFITSSDDQRSVDKETIYQCGAQMEVWRNAGLPTTSGMLKSGPCPTQELVDSYEMQATGELPVLGYSDERHLTPIVNTASGYDPANPYEGRDPRFYASVYYNGALRTLGVGGGNTRVFDMMFVDGPYNDCEINWNMAENPPYCGILTTGGDPYAYFKPVDFAINWETLKSITFSFEYMTDATTDRFRDAGFYFVVDGSIDPNKHFKLGNLAPTNGQITLFTADLTEHMKTNFADSWNAEAYIRFDFLEQQAASYMMMRNIKVTIEYEAQEAVDPNVYTYVGAPDGISVNSRRATRTGYYLRKFNNWQSNVSNNADGAIRLFRLAEVYLNFAEAAYQAKGPDTPVDLGDGTMMSARDAVNAVRRRAGMPELPAGLSASEFEKRYRNERRVELAFEEHRFFDVRRWNILDQTDKYVTGMRITRQSDESYTYERIGFARGCWSDKYKLYALEPEEVHKMVEHTGENWQNPGWN